MAQISNKKWQVQFSNYSLHINCCHHMMLPHKADTVQYKQELLGIFQNATAQYLSKCLL